MSLPRSIVSRLLPCACLFIAGCTSDAPAPAGGGSGGSSAVSPGKGSIDEYLALTKKFGDSLFAEDYAAAYGVTSSHLQKRMSLEEFTEAHKKARVEYGKPLRCDAGTGTTSADSLGDETYGPLSEVPAAVRRAWMHAQMAVELEGGEVSRCYDCWVLIVDDAGQNKIGRFEYLWCD